LQGTKRKTIKGGRDRYPAKTVAQHSPSLPPYVSFSPQWGCGSSWLTSLREAGSFFSGSNIENPGGDELI